MKRSKLLTLLIVGAASFIAGCEDEDQPQQMSVFKDVDDCVSSKVMTEDQCKNAFTASAQEHEKNGPKYNSRELCEQEYGAGQCSPRANVNGSSESVFMPMMTGFMAAQVLNSISNNNNNNCNSSNNHCNSVVPQPLYRSARDYSTYRTSGNYTVPAVSSSTSMSARSVSVRPSVVTSSVSSTGGFGTQAAARSSWGGSSASSSSSGG
jgi:uncharacterized protein YgiB involved in biofilm formation